MARLTNTTIGPITLPSRHVIPAGAELAVDNATIRDNWPTLSGRIAIGEIGVEWDHEDAAPGQVAIPAEMHPEVMPQPEAGAPVAVLLAKETAPTPAGVKKAAREARASDA